MTFVAIGAFRAKNIISSCPVEAGFILLSLPELKAQGELL